MNDTTIDPAPEAGGRTGRRGRRERTTHVEQPAWKQPRNPFRPVELVSADQLEAIHQASLTILEDIGIEFLDEEARAILKQGGAKIENGSVNVFIDRGMVDEAVSRAPGQFTMHARNPEHDLVVGGNVVPVLRGGQRAQRRGHGRRPQARQQHRFHQPGEAGADAQRGPRPRRLSGGAPGLASVGAPPRRPLRHRHPDRQGVPCLFARAASGSSTAWRSPASSAGSPRRN